MNRIILIGNGFDLAHGLKTSYADFINWYWGKRVLKLRTELSNVSSDNLCTLEINTDYSKTWHLYFYLHGHELKAMTGKEIVRRFSSDKTLFRVSKSGFFSRISSSDPQWSNIEYAYYRLLFPPAGNGPFPYDNKPKELNQEFAFVRDLLIEYLNTIEKGISTEMVKQKITKIIKEPFHKPDIAVGAMTQFSEINDRFDSSRVGNRRVTPERIFPLNFNYTTLADLYFSDSRRAVTHIHGELSKPDSIIFGYGDELDEGYKSMVNKNDNEYLRNIKSVKYLESSDYRHLLEFIESSPYQIYIMGHSCGNSDRTLLNTLFEHKNCVSIKPFYYIKENGTDNYMELVQNISRSFTDMKLMRDRVVNKTFCEPYSDAKERAL